MSPRAISGAEKGLLTVGIRCIAGLYLLQTNNFQMQTQFVILMFVMFVRAQERVFGALQLGSSLDRVRENRRIAHLTI